MQKISKYFPGMNLLLGTSAAIIVIVFLSFVLTNPDLVDNFANFWRKMIAQNFAAYLIWIVTIVAIFNIVIAFTPFGRITLGQDGEKPEFSRFSWFSMLFGAGVGTGILFYGVAEPISHLQVNPFLELENVKPISAEAGVIAQRITLFHWGIHGWACYSFVGLCLGYFSYRKGLPLTIRSALHPIIGDKIYGITGDLIDLIAVFSTLFGITVSLGLGASQMSSGLEYLFDLEVTSTFKIGVVLVVSAIATISVVSGLNKGIKLLSEINIWLCVILLSFIILAGPTMVILSSLVSGTLDYFTTLIPLSVWVDPSEEKSWQTAWTLFYWGWWISWGPFVGMFMARISRGRTIREYVMGTLLFPVLIGFVWLIVFGATALDLQLNGPGGLVEAVNKDITQAIFTAYELLNIEWATWIISLLTTILIASWFVTSSDSATLIICTILCVGEKNPPQLLRIFWGVVIGLVAGLLLLYGGLGALQIASTSIAIPFSIILILMIFGLCKSLYQTERN
tara:strand:+ start:1278 stop:2804 length:1527 start_codon:yes stop_codon:yes gene_type:complete